MLSEFFELKVKSNILFPCTSYKLTDRSNEGPKKKRVFQIQMYGSKNGFLESHAGQTNFTLLKANVVFVLLIEVLLHILTNAHTMITGM